MVSQTGEMTLTSMYPVLCGLIKLLIAKSARALSDLLPMITSFASLSIGPIVGSMTVDPVPNAFSAYFAIIIFTVSWRLLIMFPLTQISAWTRVNGSEQERAGQVFGRSSGSMLDLS